MPLAAVVLVAVTAPTARMVDWVGDGMGAGELTVLFGPGVVDTIAFRLVDNLLVRWPLPTPVGAFFTDLQAGDIELPWASIAGFTDVLAVTAVVPWLAWRHQRRRRAAAGQEVADRAVCVSWGRARRRAGAGRRCGRRAAAASGPYRIGVLGHERPRTAPAWSTSAVSADAPLPANDPMQMAPHYYGGQAVIEGVMMRGRDRWAVAVRRPDGDVWLECRHTTSAPQRKPWLKWPMIRGVFTLFDSLGLGMKALSISAMHSLPEEEREEVGGAAVGASLLMALVVFVGIFIFLPSAGTKGIDALIGNVMGDGIWFHLVESVIRIAIFLGYLWSISLVSDIRRVFQYHGAEHKTIAAWEHGEVLEPDNVDRYSTLHVRCGTNFLVLVMLLAIVVYTVGGLAVPPPEGIGWFGAVVYHVVLRIVLLPVVAGLAYEGLRLGANFGDHPLVRAIMKPGLWLQLITTKQPTLDQIEVAIRSFEAVVPAEHREGRVPTTLDSPITMPHDSLEVALESAEVTVVPAPETADDATATGGAGRDGSAPTAGALVDGSAAMTGDQRAAGDGGAGSTVGEQRVTRDAGSATTEEQRVVRGSVDDGV